MRKQIKTLRNFYFILFMVEILLFGTLMLLFFFDFPKGFKDLLKPEIWAYITSGIVLIDLIFVFVSIVQVSKIRQKNDLKAADLIGTDIQEAYNFGQIGLVVVDENDVVLWSNSLFKERNINLLDTNIFEWRKELKEIKNGTPNMTVSIFVDNHAYEVKYLPEAHLYIFRDTSDFTHLRNYERSHAMVLGLIVIDNYQDVVGNNEDENNDLISRVRSAIIDYCNKFGVVLRRFKTDSYFVVTNFESLTKMEAEGFSILGTVRDIGRENFVNPTLSIGLSHDFQDPEKLSEMASNALNIALSRGGDQCVVSQYNKELKFYGGKIAATESTSKVKIRNFADALIALIRQSKQVYIMGHSQMDMDALGSALGVKAICEYCKVPSRIIYDPRNTEKKTRFAFQGAFNKAELDKMTLTPKEAFETIKEDTLLVVTDVSVPENTHAPRVLEKSTKTVVIDHHRMGTSFIDQNVLSYIEPSASSASEIVAEFINYATANPRIFLKSSYATIMLSGMFLDTYNFKAKTVGTRTFDAAELLKTYGADNGIADDYLKDEFEEYSLTTKIVSTMKTPYYGVVYCVADDRDIIESAAISKVANQLMQLKGISASFVIGRTQTNEVKISARSDSTINVQLLAEKMHGGGHFSGAAASFKNQTVAGVETILLETLDEYLAEARATPARKGE